jgi:hypothetical protein
MRRCIVVAFACILPFLVLAACEREQGVQAGYEQSQTGTYQPRPAPKAEAGRQSQEMNGELQRVDMAAKTISIRVDNGMEQTFKFDDDTLVMGIQNASVRNLTGKEGSEVTVKWRDDNGIKVATHINVTQISSSKSLRKKTK